MLVHRREWSAITLFLESAQDKNTDHKLMERIVCISSSSNVPSASNLEMI